MATPFSLAEIAPQVSKVNIVDIGAMYLGEQPYAPLLRADRARVTAFEPNLEECEKLRKLHGESHTFHPFFIGDGSDATFYETNQAMTGSLYRPNQALLEKFQNLHELTTLVTTHDVETRRLDDIEDLGDVDFIKIDVQGSELNVFRGAEKALERATLIQTEVEFVEMYEDQPVFSDIDIILRAAGYQFHTFLGFGTRCFKPMLINNNPNRGIRQYLWADAIYVKNFLDLSGIEEDKLLKLALMLHDMFQSFDLCLFVLGEIDRRKGGSLAAAYTQRVMAPMAA